MILVIDIGNSHTVLALFDTAGELRHHWRHATVAQMTYDDLRVFAKNLLHEEGIEDSMIDGVAIASVVPRLTETWKDLCRGYFSITPLLVDGGLDVLPRMEVDEIMAVGGDRIANAAAAAALYSLPALIIDFGTATTFDVIDSEGVYRGGVITLGTQRSLEALVAAAARLSHIPLEWPQGVIGKNTETAMQSGLLWGGVCLIDGMVDYIAQELHQKPHVVATGGLGKIFAQHAKSIDDYHPHLTLYGIHALYRLNDRSLL